MRVNCRQPFSSSSRRERHNRSDSSLRRTGIRLLGDMPWGMHVCVFYETAGDLLDTCVAYFKAGLESNELCIWAISPPITTEDKHKMRCAGE